MTKSSLSSAILLFCLSGLALVGCAASETAALDASFFSETEVERINDCITKQEEEPRAQVDEPAELIGGLASLHHRLRYPPEAREVSGRVIVEFTVTDEGYPVDPEVLQAPHPALGESSMHAICLARFEPAVHHDQHVAQRMALPIQFQRADFDILIEEND